MIWKQNLQFFSHVVKHIINKIWKLYMYDQNYLRYQLTKKMFTDKFEGTDRRTDGRTHGRAMWKLESFRIFMQDLNHLHYYDDISNHVTIPNLSRNISRHKLFSYEIGLQVYSLKPTHLVTSFQEQIIVHLNFCKICLSWSKK